MKKPMFIVILIAVLIVSAGATYFIFASQSKKEEPVTSELTKPEVTVDSSMRPDTAQQESTISVQRQDVEVKNRMSLTATGLNTYITNNRGQLPTTEEQLVSFVDQYLVDAKDELHPVTKAAYRLTFTISTSSDIQYKNGFTCSEDGSTMTAGSPRQFALLTTLPSGAKYCLGS